jgi:hypothetical protein
MSVWSLRQALSDINGDLPEDFDATGGIRSLFPPGQAAAISTLKSYRYRADAALTTSQLDCRAVVKATGSGKWVLSGSVTANGTDLIPVRFHVGFTFRNPVDGYLHGAFASESLPIHTGTVSQNFYASGRDEWIVEHWPEAFAEGTIAKFVVEEDVGTLIHLLTIGGAVGVAILASGGAVTVFF